MQIQADIVLLESNDIATAISEEISRQSIRHLVIGGPSAGGIFSMKHAAEPTGDELGQVIAKSAPSFCTVYIIVDGKLQQLRPADSEQNVITMEDTHNLSTSSADSSSGSLTIDAGLSNTSDSSNSASQPKPESHSRNASRNKFLSREEVELKHYEFKNTDSSFRSQSSGTGDSGSWISDRTTPTGSYIGTHSDARSSVGTTPSNSYVGVPPTHSMGTPSAASPAGTPPKGSYVGAPKAVSRSGTPGGSYVGTAPTAPTERNLRSVSFLDVPSGSESDTSSSQISEIEKLRIELQQIAKMFERTQNSSIDKRLDEITKERLQEAIKLKEEKGKELARMEKKKSKAAQNEAVNAWEKAEQNKTKNKTDSQAAREAEESKNRLKALFSSPAVQYQKFTWEEIMEATSSLSNEFKIGMGAFGTVYKCKLHHTTVAVKVLHCKDSVTNKQFVQELEILSTIRHPHLLLLLGAVPEESCLVYEYMDHGSLDDRLFHKNGKPPLPWYDRFRICYEVASALAFLHSTTPRPIIHRDLKPANILLDHNLVSKIGDAGLGTMINVEPTSESFKTIYKETSPVGTLCYIDPEYQRTGRVSTKSDIYALGVVILQLLAGKPAVGIAYMVEDAMDEGNLTEILDPLAGQWPKKESFELAVLGLQCAELRGRDRPDIREKILPILERLKELADSARESVSNAQTATPPHFFCPILKDMMEDPYVAADGYTYERRAIEQWLVENDTSPITDELIPHKFIMPNTTLLEAIKQWKSKK
ncbi:U-box domain-containing protein 35 [Bienertia sinuspersici]